MCRRPVVIASICRAIFGLVLIALAACSSAAVDSVTRPSPHASAGSVPGHVYLLRGLVGEVFSLGFLKQGGKCPGVDTMPGSNEATKKNVRRDANGVPVCTIETFADVGLQVTENDRPFFKDQFPYLARPWFYPKPAEGTPYFWPTAQRLEVPE